MCNLDVLYIRLSGQIQTSENTKVNKVSYHTSLCIHVTKTCTSVLLSPHIYY